MPLTPEELQYVMQHNDVVQRIWPYEVVVALGLSMQGYDLFFRLLEPFANDFDRTSYGPPNAVQFRISGILVYIHVDEFHESSFFSNVDDNITAGVSSIYDGAILAYDVMSRASFDVLPAFDQRLCKVVPTPKVLNTQKASPEGRRKWWKKFSSVLQSSSFKKPQQGQIDGVPEQPGHRPESKNHSQPAGEAHRTCLPLTETQPQDETQSLSEGQLHQPRAVLPGPFPLAVVVDRKEDVPLEEWLYSREEAEEFARSIGATFHLISTSDNT